MLRIGINGLGRIGRSILRSNLIKDFFEVVAINDINPDIDNLAYTLNYDSLYGPLEEPFKSKKGELLRKDTPPLKIFHYDNIADVPWEESRIDFLIDSSGVKKNVSSSRDLLNQNKVSKIFITHCPEEVDFTMVLGANEEEFDQKKHNLISTSICDATALAPVLKDLDNKYGINSGSITTSHPWLSYQNLMDGPSSSWSVPGEIFHHYALGRSVIGNIIPKPTSAVSATCKVLKNLTEEDIISFSYRVPTAIVGSADVSLNLKNKTSTEEVIEYFNELEKNQKFKIYKNNIEPLISLDFLKADYSSVVDHRWTEVIKGNFLKIVLWYDNEWGYSNRVLDQLKFVEKS